MQNNGRPHIARVVSDYLRNIEIPVKEWPALDPDLNSIRKYGKTATGNGTASKSLKSAKRSTSGIWGNVDQNDIRNLILSMSERCQAKEDNTRFKENNL
jgi:hypothetical protein